MHCRFVGLKLFWNFIVRPNRVVIGNHIVGNKLMLWRDYILSKPTPYSKPFIESCTERSFCTANHFAFIAVFVLAFNEPGQKRTKSDPVLKKEGKKGRAIAFPSLWRKLLGLKVILVKKRPKQFNQKTTSLHRPSLQRTLVIVPQGIYYF